MNLFSRNLSVDPLRAVEGYTFGAELAARVTKTTGLAVSVWRPLYGTPAGTISFSCRVDSLAAMGAASDKLEADKGYMDLLASNDGRLIGPLQDNMSQFVSIAGEPNLAGRYVSIITAQMAPGKLMESMTWSVEILEHVVKLTGVGGSLVRGLFGPYATIAWLGLYESLEQLDTADAQEMADEAYLNSVNGAGDLFVTGSVSSVLLQRVN